jgi:hypothetical protein
MTLEKNVPTIQSHLESTRQLMQTSCMTPTYFRVPRRPGPITEAWPAACHLCRVKVTFRAGLTTLDDS